MADFREAFSGPNAKNFMPNRQMAEACLVVSILEPKVKYDNNNLLLSQNILYYYYILF